MQDCLSGKMGARARERGSQPWCFQNIWQNSGASRPPFHAEHVGNFSGGQEAIAEVDHPWYQPLSEGCTWQRRRASSVVRPEGYLSSSIQASTIPLSICWCGPVGGPVIAQPWSVGVTKSPRFPSSPSEEKGATESGGWRWLPSPGKFAREVADCSCRANV